MLADEEQVLAAIRRERENLQWINESLSRLRELYGDRYVAVRDRRVIDSDPDLEALLSRVRRLEKPEDVTIEYVTALEYIWVL